MQLILIKIKMRKRVQKFADIRPLAEVLGELPQGRRPHPDEGAGRDRRNQLALKIAVLHILQAEQFFSDVVDDHIHILPKCFCISGVFQN